MDVKTEPTRRTQTADDARTDPPRDVAAHSQAAYAEQPREKRQTTNGGREMGEREVGENERTPDAPPGRVETEMRELEGLRAQLVTALGRQSASLTILRKAVEEADHASELVQGLRKQIGALEKKLEQGGRKQRADEVQRRPAAPPMRAW